MSVAVVVPVYRNADTLLPLAERLAVALSDTTWCVRLVIDASPDASAAVARAIAARDPRVRVTELAVNGGQHRALARGLADEPGARAWVCMDADLQDPPEAVPGLLRRLAGGDVRAVFAGRRGAYEGVGRRLTGSWHRRAVRAMTGLPADAGAFLALDARGRAAALAASAGGAPSLVVGLGVARLPVASVPVARAVRPTGSSAWTPRARLVQSVRSLAWAASRSADPPLDHERRPAAPEEPLLLHPHPGLRQQHVAVHRSGLPADDPHPDVPDDVGVGRLQDRRHP